MKFVIGLLSALTLLVQAIACDISEPQVPVQVRGETNSWKTVKIDSCLAPIVAQLQTTNVTTITSCCGHGKGDGYILLGKWEGSKLIANRIITISPELTEEQAKARYWKDWDTMSRTNEKERK